MVIRTRKRFLELLDVAPPCPDGWLGQMASIPLPIEDANLFKNNLLEIYNIQVPIFVWEGQTSLRYSIQAYNSEKDLEKLFSAVKELLN